LRPAAGDLDSGARAPMLRLTGRKADGWLPTKLDPDGYGRALGAIR
jgi:hypothetical protein